MVSSSAAHRHAKRAIRAAFLPAAALCPLRGAADQRRSDSGKLAPARPASQDGNWLPGRRRKGER